MECEERIHNTFSNPELGEDANEALVRVCTQAIFGIVEKGGIEGVKGGEDAQRLIDGVKEDLRSGTRAGFEMKWVWGRRTL